MPEKQDENWVCQSTLYALQGRNRNPGSGCRRTVSLMGPSGVCSHFSDLCHTTRQAGNQRRDDPTFQRANIWRCLPGWVAVAVLSVSSQEGLRCSKLPQLPRIASLLVQSGSCSFPGSIDPLSRQGAQQVCKLDASFVSSIGKLGGSSWPESNLRF